MKIISLKTYVILWYLIEKIIKKYCTPSGSHESFQFLYYNAPVELGLPVASTYSFHYYFLCKQRILIVQLSADR